MKALIAAGKRLVGRVTEVTGILLAIFAAYEALIANRVAPTLIGGYTLCPHSDKDWHEPREVLFDFLREHADTVVYVDFFVAPVDTDAVNESCNADGGWVGRTSETGLRARGPSLELPDGSTSAEPELVIDYDTFNVPQTARLTSQSGEEPIFGVKGLVYIEAGEVDMGFRDFSLAPAPYAEAMLKKRDCTKAYVEAEGVVAKARAYLFSCLKQ